MSKRCGTCKWARFEMTNHNPPRPKKGQFGDCDYPVDQIKWPPLPYAITSYRGYPQTAKSAIWPDTGTDCPTWEAADAAPQSPKHCNCSKENHNDVGEEGARCYVCGGTNR